MLLNTKYFSSKNQQKWYLPGAAKPQPIDHPSIPSLRRRGKRGGKKLTKKRGFYTVILYNHYAAMRHPENHEHILDVSVRPLAKTKRQKNSHEFRCGDTPKHQNGWLYFQSNIPSNFPIFSKRSIAHARSSLPCVAESITRMRALSMGTVG